MKTIIKFVTDIIYQIFYKIPTSRDEDHLFLAIHNYDIDSVKQIISQNSTLVNRKGEFGYTPLHRSAFHMNLEATELLIAKGANKNAINKFGSTPLHEAAGTLYNTKFNLKIMELLTSGVDINARDNGGNTPLHAACSSNNPKCIEFLLLNGADANITNNNNKTALNFSFYFLKSLNTEVFKLLYIRSEGNIDKLIRDHRLYTESELKPVIDIALEIKPLMQIIKNLFVRDGVLELSQENKEHVSINLPKFKTLSTEEDSNKYQEFCNYYEMPAKYFQLLLLKAISKAQPKELHNLPNIIHNNIMSVQNIKTEQMLNFVVFIDSIGNVITLKQHIYQNSLIDKMCVGTQGEKDYSVISLKYLVIMKILNMLAEKKINEQEVTTTISQDLWFDTNYINKIINFTGDVQTETTAEV